MHHLTTEEVRARWLGSSPVHLRVLEYLDARILKQDSAPEVTKAYVLIFQFYHAHGFIPARPLSSLVNVLAALN